MGPTHAGPNDTLRQSQPLRDGHALISNNGLFVAVLQADANFVVYRGTAIGDMGHGHLWAHDKNAGGCPCFAIVQGDGNLVVYRGTGPNDQHEAVWATNRYTRGNSGPYFLILQDDGNLVEYHGASQADQGAVQWATDKLDPPVGFEQIQQMNYRLDQAKVTKTSATEIFNQVVRNDTDQVQTSTLTATRSFSEQSGWSDTITDKVGVKAGTSLKIPFVGKDGPELQIEVTYEHEWSKSTNSSVTTTKEWGFSTPISLQPHSNGRVTVSISSAEISVPYQVAGSAVFSSGTRMPVNVSGIYTGTNSYEMDVQFQDSTKSDKKTILQKRLVVEGANSKIVTTDMSK